ncbi:MAG: hypothetical protein D6702_00930 [Planctomycetota bacterium]|nr:MAG: hypothetical protein D6702_00930 [Planctomycetota bacterium]
MTGSLLSRRRLFRALPALLLLAAPLAAQADFSASVSFGDSLTHNDLLGLVYGNPQDLYGKDPFHASWSKGAQPGDHLSNYAVGGSESRHLHTQIELFDFMVLIGVEPEPTLIDVEIGGNDFLNNRDLLASAPPGVDPMVDDVVDRLLVRLERDVRHLARKYRQAKIVLWTIPDIVLAPAVWGRYSATEEANIRAHLARANQAIRAAAAARRIAVYDFAAAFAGYVASPPAFYGHPLVGPPAYGDYDHLFADDIHPTAVHNALHANGILDALEAAWGGSFPRYSERELADLAHIP